MGARLTSVATGGIKRSRTQTPSSRGCEERRRQDRIFFLRRFREYAFALISETHRILEFLSLSESREDVRHFIRVYFSSNHKTDIDSEVLELFPVNNRETESAVCFPGMFSLISFLSRNIYIDKSAEIKDKPTKILFSIRKRAVSLAYAGYTVRREQMQSAIKLSFDNTANIQQQVHCSAIASQCNAMNNPDGK